MAHARVTEIETLTHHGQQLIVQRARRRLLLSAAFRRGAPLLVAGREIVRRGQVEQIDVAAGDTRIRALHASARDHHDAIARDAVRVLEPAQERNPIQHLVADFRQPWSDDDRRRAPRKLCDRAVDGLGIALERLMLPGACLPAHHAHERLRRGLQPARSFESEIANRVESAHIAVADDVKHGHPVSGSVTWRGRARSTMMRTPFNPSTGISAITSYASVTCASTFGKLRANASCSSRGRITNGTDSCFMRSSANDWSASE